MALLTNRKIKRGIRRESFCRNPRRRSNGKLPFELRQTTNWHHSWWNHTIMMMMMLLLLMVMKLEATSASALTCGRSASNSRGRPRESRNTEPWRRLSEAPNPGIPRMTVVMAVQLIWNRRCVSTRIIPRTRNNGNGGSSNSNRINSRISREPTTKPTGTTSSSGSANES